MTGVNQKNILKELKVDLILLYASKKDTYHLIFCFSDLIQRCSGDFYEPQGLGNVSFKFTLFQKINHQKKNIYLGSHTA